LLCNKKTDSEKNQTNYRVNDYCYYIKEVSLKKSEFKKQGVFVFFKSKFSSKALKKTKHLNSIRGEIFKRRKTKKKVVSLNFGIRRHEYFVITIFSFIKSS
jgi:hypothetical protein